MWIALTPVCWALQDSWSNIQCVFSKPSPFISCRFSRWTGTEVWLYLKCLPCSTDFSYLRKLGPSHWETRRNLGKSLPTATLSVNLADCSSVAPCCWAVVMDLLSVQNATFTTVPYCYELKHHLLHDKFRGWCGYREMFICLNLTTLLTDGLGSCVGAPCPLFNWQHSSFQQGGKWLMQDMEHWKLVS